MLLFFHFFQESSYKAVTQGTALHYLQQRQILMENSQVISSNHTGNGNGGDLNGIRTSGLTAQNVAALTANGRISNGHGPKPEYSNGHLHRAQHVQPRADSPATNNAPPALPPRSHHLEPPQVGRRISNCQPPTPSSSPYPNPPVSNGVGVQQGPADVPPPLPPRLGERGHSPTPSQHYSNLHSNSPYATTSYPPPLLRQSPLPTSVSMQAPSRGLPAGGPGSRRGTSPITTAAPLKVPNSMEIQQQFNTQQVHHSNIFPAEGQANTEPPPPYPMGPSAVPPNQPTPSSSPYPNPPPPSYSQSMQLRQSPTLSNTSSDNRMSNYPNIEFRRSPAPVNMGAPSNNPHLIHAYQMQNGGTPMGTPIPTSPSPSASSMMSTSSRNSSTLQWRQASDF